MVETLQNYTKIICRRSGRKATGEGRRRKNSSKRRKRRERSIPEKKVDPSNVEGRGMSEE